MKPLPRPVREVLAPPSQLDARVAAIWGDLQRERRLRRTAPQPALALAFATALVALVVAFWPNPQAPVAESLATDMVACVDAAPATASLPVGRSIAPLLQGRHTSARRPALRPMTNVSTTTPLNDDGSVDVVAVLLESADVAWRAGKRSEVKALLADVGAHHGEDQRAATALYVLGRLQLEDGQSFEASGNFRHALELNPPEELVAPLWELLQRSEQQR